MRRNLSRACLPLSIRNEGNQKGDPAYEEYERQICQLHCCTPAGWPIERNARSAPAFRGNLTLLRYYRAGSEPWWHCRAISPAEPPRAFLDSLRRVGALAIGHVDRGNDSMLSGVSAGQPILALASQILKAEPRRKWELRRRASILAAKRLVALRRPHRCRHPHLPASDRGSYL
jgi:hypothetical protein